MTNTTFNEIRQKNFRKLKLYLPIVARVHGAHHPEIHEVRAIFDSIVQKVKKAGQDRSTLEEDFLALRKVTNNYTIPNDVCESYAAVYDLLAEVDKAYHA